LRSTVERCYNNVEHYRKKLDAAGVHPRDIISLEDIRKIPFTVKDELRQNYPYKLFAVPMRDIVRIHASSGTTGKPTVVGYTKADIDMWAENIARLACAAGATPEDIAQITFGYTLFTGAFGLHYGLEKLGATVIPISGGNTEITGNFTIEEADDLANILKSGKMPAPSKIVSNTVVGPTLGKEAINSGMISFAIAFLLVLFYMIFYYSKSAGTIADIALLSNVFLLFGVLASLGAVLTLPGIAGIVLTMGMAVDANVLIYERIREELRAGKGVKLAISEGYQKAYSAIIDSNVTTLLTGIILYVFGTGPIKGFATTLVIGILTSLFTAIFVTRLIYEYLLKRNKELTFSIKLTANILKNTHIDFIGMRKYFYAASLIVTVVGIGSLFVRGLNQGIDFKGGRTFVVRFDNPVKTEDVAKALAGPFVDPPQVVTYGSSNQVKITTKYKIDEPGADDEVDTKLYDGLKGMIGANVSRDQFLSKYRQSSETIGPTIASDIKIKAFYAVVIALIMMFFYIFMRFRNWQYGFGAVASLIHDTLFVIGIYSLLWGILPFSLEIDQSFIAAILTVIGYSVNDTVIVFDRLREYIPLYRKRPIKEVLNMAMNSTLSRTINTSLTTLLTVIAIFIFGGEVIRGFVFALMIGIGVGTYSSIFIASMLMYDSTMKEKVMPKAS
jgi:SecD/SecF fusion protein